MRCVSVVVVVIVVKVVRGVANYGLLSLHFKLWHTFNGKRKGNVCVSENAEIM